MSNPKKEDLIAFRCDLRTHRFIHQFATDLNLSLSEFLRDGAFIAMNAAGDRVKWERLKAKALSGLTEKIEWTL